MTQGELHARVGETRRLTIMFCDVVGSTELSARLEPESYRMLIRRYRSACREVIEARFEGHVVNWKGDGVMAPFGFPVAHENDAERAVRAGLALVDAVEALGESLEVRVGVHHGDVYADFDEDDVEGLAANLVARLQTLADPGTVVVSDEIRRLVEHQFVVEARDAQMVKGVDEPLAHYRVIGERRAAGRRTWSTPLVERVAELEALRENWARGGRVLVRGDAGVGKTRLVTAFTDELGAPVLWLNGSPFHADAGFHPIRRMIEARCGIDEDMNGAERLERLAREAPEAVTLLAPVLGIDPSAGYEPATAEGHKLEEQVTGAVLDHLRACLRPRPAAIVAENLHWFDAATRAVLADLRHEEGVLVIGTSRDEERGRWETIELQPLTADGRLELIEALDETLGDDDRQALAARSGGVPLFLEELVRAGTAPAPAYHPPVPGSVPAVLYEPLVARLYAAPAALPVAAAAAAAGQAVDRALLADTMAMPSEDLDSSLRTLVDAEILEPIGSRYQFRHELLREVAYELQPPSWRRKVHDRLCDLLVRDEPSDWHVLATHFERADRLSEAATAYQHTAEEARRRGALDEALGHLTHAIDLVAGLDEDAARDHREVRVRLLRGFLAMSEGGAGDPTAAEDFERCRELAAADPSGDDMFSTLTSLWAYYLSLAELDRARAVSVTLREALEGEREHFRPQNLAGFGILDWFEGRFDSAVDTLAAATRQLAEVGREEAVVDAWYVPNDPAVAMHLHYALARFTAGDTAGAEESLARARAVAAALDFPQGAWSTAYVDWLASWLWIETGELDRAEEAVAALGTASARHGFVGWEATAAMQTVTVEGLRAADPAEHAEGMMANIMVWEAAGLRVFLPFYMTTAGALLAAAGDGEGAREQYEASLALAAETGMRFYDAETRRRLALLDEATAADGLRSALDLARAQGARPFEDRIAADLAGLR